MSNKPPVINIIKTKPNHSIYSGLWPGNIWEFLTSCAEQCLKLSETIVYQSKG